MPAFTHPNDTLTIPLGFRATTPNAHPITASIRLINTIPDDHLPVIETDFQPCASYPSPVWMLDETIIYPVELVVPAGVNAGIYTITISLYQTDTQEQLPTTPTNFLHTIKIMPYPRSLFQQKVEMKK